MSGRNYAEDKVIRRISRGATQERERRRQASAEARAGRAVLTLIKDVDDPERMLRAIGKALGDQMAQLVGPIEAATFFAARSRQLAPDIAGPAKGARAAAEALFDGEAA